MSVPISSGLNQIYDGVSEKMSNVEESVTSALAGIRDGGEVTQAQLLNLQFQMSKYSVTASVFSSIIKEMSDSLKQTANKIG
jgi:hypothetical protein